MEMDATTADVARFADWTPNRSQWLIFLCLSIVSLLVSLDSSIIGPALPTFGRRELLLLSLAVFTIGTIICCIAQNFATLLAGRCIQGTGGGGSLSLVLVIMTDIVPLRQRPKYYSLIQFAWAIGLIVGPTAGGAFAEHSTWRWVFYINLPFCAMGLSMVPFVVRLKAQRASMCERLANADWMGAVLFISSTCSFLIGITWGGSQYARSSWQTCVPIIFGTCGVVATLCWERYRATHPFLKMELFQDHAATAAYTCAILQGLLMFSALYYFPLYLQSVQGFGPTASGAGLIPVIGGLIPTSIIVGRLITQLGSYRWAIWSGWIAIIISSALVIILSASTPTYGWILLFATTGPSHGLVLTSLNFALQALAEERDSAYAAAMYTFTRTFGMCLGVAIGGVVIQNRLLVHLAELGLEERIAREAESFIVVLNTMPASATVAAYRLAYAETFRNLFEVNLGIAVIAGLASAFVKHASMDRVLDSEHNMDEK